MLVPLLEIFVQKPIHKLRSNINKSTHKLWNKIKKATHKLRNKIKNPQTWTRTNGKLRLIWPQKMLAQNLKATRSLARAWWSENGEFRVKAGLTPEKFTIYHEMYCMTESYLRYVFYCKTIIIFSCGYSNLYFLLSKIYLCENAFCTPVLSKYLQMYLWKYL